MEDLNIERMKLRILNRCWYDMEQFPTIRKIANVTGMTERTIHRFAKDNNLPKRTKTNIRKCIATAFIKTLPSS